MKKAKNKLHYFRIYFLLQLLSNFEYEVLNTEYAGKFTADKENIVLKKIKSLKNCIEKLQ